MILFTQVSVPMTDFKIDVFIGGTKEEYDLVEEERYSLRPDVNAEFCKNECCSIETGSRGFIKNLKVFQIKLEYKPIDNVPYFIHELWHLMWKISNVISDFELNKSSEAWAANMIEKIAFDILNAKYEELNLEFGE